MNLTVLWLYTTVYSILVLVGRVHSIVKLQNVGTNPDGLVLVDKSNEPKPVCSGCWTRNNSKVVCRQLGHGDGDSYETEATGNSALPGYSCNGNETTLEECVPLSSQCSCTKFAAVRCRGAVRVNAALSSAQIDVLEFFYDIRGVFQWGGLYSYGWKNTEADVACRQLGYRSGSAMNKKITSPNTISVWKGCYNCRGNESNLNQCDLKGQNCPTCVLIAGVQCTGDGNWGHWNPWERCSVTCESGVQSRTRKCYSPKPKNGGQDCQGIDHESQSCNLSECPSDGNLGQWNQWGRCSVTCESGVQSRKRKCDSPKLKNGGQDCQGIDHESRSCNLPKCPIDGNWGQWNHWGRCPVTCGIGVQSRRRECDSPRREYGGQYCRGTNYDTKACEEQECPIDGNWGQWNHWGICPVTCGIGVQSRTRECDSPRREYGSCQGTNYDTKTCKEQECPIDGNWSHWDQWGRCPVTCGRGIQRRTRKCNNPRPEYGGQNCSGINYETQSCNEHECPKLFGDSCHADDTCESNLVCNSNDTGTCSCQNYEHFWDRKARQCQRKSSYSALLITKKLDFESANGYCIQNITGFLATEDYIDHVVLECLREEKNLWLEQLSESMQSEDSQLENKTKCQVYSEDSGTLLNTSYVNCSEQHYFVCIINRTADFQEQKCPSSEKELVPIVETNMMYGLVAGGIAVIVLIIVVTVIIIRRYRNKNTRSGSKSGGTVSFGQGSGVTFGLHNQEEVIYNEPGDENRKTPDKKDQASWLPDNRANARGEISGVDQYGYGVLHGASAAGSGGRNADEADMYHHARQSRTDNNEYDSFIKKVDKESDINDMYDHTSYTKQGNTESGFDTAGSWGRKADEADMYHHTRQGRTDNNEYDSFIKKVDKESDINDVYDHTSYTKQGNTGDYDTFVTKNAVCTNEH